MVIGRGRIRYVPEVRGVFREGIRRIRPRISMTEVGIQHHGVLFTFEVDGLHAAVSETLIYDERDAMAFFGSIAMEELEVAGANLFAFDRDFKAQVIHTARIRERVESGS